VLPTRVSFSFDLQGASLRRATRKKADPARGRPVGGDGDGRGIAPPQWLAEGGHLEFSGLATDGFARVFDLAFEGLPGLADDLLVGGDSAFGGHT
jgi:hypothetical protein